MNQNEVREWPAGGGAMQERIRAHDWRASGLGETGQWPSCLRLAVDILLGLPAPALLLWGRRGALIYNERWRALAGETRAGVLGSHVTESADALSRRHAEALDAVLAGREARFHDLELACPAQPGEPPVSLSLDYAPVPADDGKPAGAFVVATDTTARMTLGRQLQESRARLAALFARAPVGLSEISGTGRFLGVNDALCRMLGRGSEDMLQRTVQDVTHPDDVPATLEAFSRLREARGPVSLDKRYLDAGGTVVWARSSLTLLGQGADRTVLAVTVDLTPHKLAEQALAESEARFRALAEASPALIWHIDPRGRVTYLNQRYMEMTGRTAEYLDKNWAAELHPDERAAYIERMADAQRSRSPIKLRVRVRTAHGSWLWLETHASPWFSAGGRYAGHVGFSIDITDVVLAQEELQVSNERLKLAIEGSGDLVWDWDIPQDKVVYSDRLQEMLGYRPGEGFDSHCAWQARMHPDDRQEVAEALARCLDGRAKAYRQEHRVMCRNGDWKWVMARAIVVARDSHGAPLRMTGTITDISEKRKSEEVIWRHANFDGLTGLPNRRLFRDRLEHEVLKARRNGLPMALLFIDLDRFKEANDLLGHDVGDQLLIEAANRIRHCVRSSDTLARLGGDEFTAILAELDDLAHVEWIAQKIIAILGEPFRLGDEVVYLSASVGITLFPSDASTPEDLIRNADQAMYAAKNSGRSRFSYFTPAMQKLAQMRLRLIADLRGALAAGQLQVWYQPVVELASGRIVKAEALLRWFHPRLGSVEPQHFIPYAEESGLINEIGEWVFREAAVRSREWSARLDMPFQVSVNKSPVQFLARGRDSDWGRHLNELGLPGNSISVEITEGLLLNASNMVADRLLQFRDAGIQVAIDDFGTGYSSMAYLRKFDIDYLKIDRSFVREVAVDSGDRAIVRSIIAMAHELGMQVIAEGIETDAQRASLLDAGCDFGQGFLFSHALPAEEFGRLLRAPQASR
ncbi:MAG TPA: EAL domain-containing protein [Noviherbaspirillum sp.]|jgi:diguanylate cyclase (GGDEF)-like protein/PAS domain S-box-containing protein|uniref:EAL domain-containing protein n=1 Tax=Noviherbaspirillum sp. TaxID=1926288 RepID=UPI002F9495B5